MPNIKNSSYKPVFFLANGHLETIFPAIFHKVSGIQCESHRIKTTDQDFLDLDWYRKKKRKKIVIISHGLEGNSKKSYIRGTVRKFVSNGWDAIAWNYRGCSGQTNRTVRFYHSGATDDLHQIIQIACDAGYNTIALTGFSLGGNLILKYLGEAGRTVAHQIKSAVAFSVPLDLYGGCIEISKPSNAVYSRRFLIKLKDKVRRKAKIIPELDTKALKHVKTLFDFDNLFTAPLHGFKDAEDYYSTCSSGYYVGNIRIPTLIVNAKNDPFLSDSCYPYELFDPLEHVWFETPERGGHVGFLSKNSKGLYYWSENRALEFTEQYT